PPPILYAKGSLTAVPTEAVAMVGMRKATATGKLAAGVLAGDLAGRGLLVVSGLARGIDSAAHRGALEKGITAAVLGCGLDVAYPRENARLMEQVCNQGVALSEFPLGTPPNAWHFPARNRIISGLALAVIVVEAEEKSGSLITVDCALEQGRDVYAVPGNIFAPGSRGPHKLLKQGAAVVTCGQDVVDLLGLESLFPPGVGKEQPQPVLSPGERDILRLLDSESLGIEELAARSGLTAAALLPTLTYLELKGLLKQIGGQNFQRVPDFS
ncbi:MAG TPA: DNA-processing protein DprA, partial [Bacillota bacterium]|nr:DNA-processing protein DprA [Bacillota bacterium]